MLDTKIFFKNKAKGVEIKKDRVGIVTDKGTMKARVVVGADGANSIIARAINSKLRFKLGIIAIKRERDNGKAVDLYFRKDLVRDGFLWHIPRGNAREYGMFGSNANYSMLEKFFGIKKYKRFGGLMPAGYRKTYADRILLIGDAASQTKPWSGGGVIYSLACAKLSAYILKRAFDKEDFSSGMLRLYEVLWKRLIGWQIKAGMLFWDAYSMAPTSCMRAAFLFIKGLQHALDMDFIKS
ncbi:MAG TPA: hypothetical protein ENG42_00150 [Candidatus Aenigmarchaeota archaeon]|nr:hypothetical protein [Candidatus Aenigmarchaeota archaeon]